MYNFVGASMDARADNVRIEVSEWSREKVLEPSVPALAASSIHIWQFPLTISSIPLSEYAALLAEDEKSRAARFHFEKDARRFTVTRAAVRTILAGYTASSGGELRFDYSHYGKPRLVDAATDVRFSISHSGDRAMLAVALGHDVGVDLEAIRANVETLALAERYFSERERATLRVLFSGEQVLGFFRCWTCKEAFLKGQGFGLSRSLESFDVEVNPSRPARLLATRPDAEDAKRWTLHDVPVEENYAAAVAWEGSIAEMKIYRCS
jgi:4'-phosphopantetheinyl transferase